MCGCRGCLREPRVHGLRPARRALRRVDGEGRHRASREARHRADAVGRLPCVLPLGGAGGGQPEAGARHPRGEAEDADRDAGRGRSLPLRPDRGVYAPAGDVRRTARTDRRCAESPRGRRTFARRASCGNRPVLPRRRRHGATWRGFRPYGRKGSVGAASGGRLQRPWRHPRASHRRWLAVRRRKERRQRAVDSSRQGPEERDVGDIQGRIVLCVFVERRAVRAERQVQPVRGLRDAASWRRLHCGGLGFAHTWLRQGEGADPGRDLQPEADSCRRSECAGAAGGGAYPSGDA